jgi:uncharacterized protein YdgA (DUF945 family)/uncharacterized protein YneF (UPF0154 family)
MKKLAVVALLLGAGYVGGAYLTGYLGEQNMRQQLSLSQAQSAESGMLILLDSYERGLFSSDIKLTMRSTSPLPMMQQAEVHMNSQVSHGPVLFNKGLALGLFAATTQVKLQFKDAELSQKLGEFFGDSIGEIHTLANFNNSYSARWTLAEKKHEVESFHLSLGESWIDMRGRFDSLNVAGELHLGAFSLVSDDGSEITSQPAEGKFALDNIESGLSLGNMELLLSEMQVKTAAGMDVVLHDLAYKQTQALVNKAIDTHVGFSIAKVAGPVELSNLYYQVDLNQLNVEAVKAWAKVAQQMPSDPAELNSFYAAQFKQLMPLFLQEGLALKLAMGAEFMGGHPKAEWTIRYKAPADGASLADLTEAFEYLALVDSQLEVRLPEAVALGLPMLAMMGDYVTQDAGEYVLTAKLSDSDLVVGQKPIPRETLLMMLAGMGVKPSAAADAETQAAIDAAEAQQAADTQGDDTAQ